MLRLAAQKELLEEREELVTREAVRAERDRIARELHDVIAHSVSAMVVQTAAAQDLVRTDPTRAERVLRDVADTGRRALVETGRLLHVIRDDADELGLDPAPGVADLERLVREFRAEGLEVDLSVDERLGPTARGDRRLGLPDRAGGAHQRAAVRRWDRHPAGHRPRRRRGHPGDQPDGPARASMGSGLGLRGLAERVSLLGGTLTPRQCRRPLRARRDAAGGAGMTSVVIADDQDLIRSGLRMVLEARGIEVLGEAADGRAAVEAVAALRPDVVLMDIRMPVLDGIAATREIASPRAGDPGAGAHDVRRRLLRLRRAAGRCRRVPAQGDGTRPAGDRHRDRECGGGAAGAVADAAPDRAARPRAGSRRRRARAARAR